MVASAGYNLSKARSSYRVELSALHFRQQVYTKAPTCIVDDTLGQQEWDSGSETKQIPHPFVTWFACCSRLRKVLTVFFVAYQHACSDSVI